jgi:hypothetical protein
MREGFNADYSRHTLHTETSVVIVVLVLALNSVFFCSPCTGGRNFLSTSRQKYTYYTVYHNLRVIRVPQNSAYSRVRSSGDAVRLAVRV